MVNIQRFLVEGVGKGTIPGCMDFSVIDDVIQVKVISNKDNKRPNTGLHDNCQDEDAFHTCHELARREGLLVGGSAGLNTWAAVQIANNLEVSSEN